MRTRKSLTVMILMGACGPGSDDANHAEVVALDPIEGCVGVVDDAEPESDGLSKSIPSALELEWVGSSGSGPVRAALVPGATGLLLESDCAPGTRKIRSLECAAETSCNVRCVTRVESDCDFRLSTTDTRVDSGWLAGVAGETEDGTSLITVSATRLAELGEELRVAVQLEPDWREREARLELEWTEQNLVGRIMMVLTGPDGQEGFYTLAVVRREA